MNYIHVHELQTRCSHIPLFPVYFGLPSLGGRLHGVDIWSPRRQSTLRILCARGNRNNEVKKQKKYKLRKIQISAEFAHWNFKAQIERVSIIASDRANLRAHPMGPVLQGCSRKPMNAVSGPPRSLTTGEVDVAS